MTTVHWLGTGLSAVPGLQRLITQGHRVRVYNRSLARAQQAVAGLEGDVEVRPFELDQLPVQLDPGDVLVSMLPGEFHVPLAQLCLEQGAHFVSSSYISDAMRALDAQAKAAGLCLVNEVGLDPGIDHSMAHALMAAYQQSAAFSPANAHYFTSYCGGLSEQPNDFCYRFSWSPLGVLRALTSTSVSIRDGADYTVSRPWTAVEELTLELPAGAETFEVYPNRDSRPFMAQYHVGTDWNVQQFVRGTLRYQGWKQAWQPIFQQLEQGMDDAGLRALSDELWERYQLTEGEADRVVLVVSLRAEHAGETVWHQSYLLNAVGNAQGSAMARLVSIPLSLAVEAVLQDELSAGVSAAPDQPELVQRWLDTVGEIADYLACIDHLKT